MDLIWGKIKIYIYAGFAFFIALLGGYAAYQKQRSENLKEKLDKKENNLKVSEAQIKSKDEVRKEDSVQSNNIETSEKDKSESNSEINDILSRSEKENIEVKL